MATTLASQADDCSIVAVAREVHSDLDPVSEESSTVSNGGLGKGRAQKIRVAVERIQMRQMVEQLSRMDGLHSDRRSIQSQRSLSPQDSQLDPIPE